MYKTNCEYKIFNATQNVRKSEKQYLNRNILSLNSICFFVVLLLFFVVLLCSIVQNLYLVSNL